MLKGGDPIYMQKQTCSYLGTQNLIIPHTTRLLPASHSPTLFQAMQRVLAAAFYAGG